MKKNLLIIDDEESILIAYRQLFKSNTVNVDVADNLNAAEMLILSNKYDVVITDLELSMEKKHEGMSIIKNVNKLYPHALKIIITAYGNNEIKEEAFAAGTDFYFEKPVSIKLIKSVIENSGHLNTVSSKVNGKNNIKASLQNKG